MGAKIRLRGDPPGTPLGSGDPTVTVERRVRSGYDADKTPLWTFQPIITDARAVTWESRARTDRHGTRTGFVDVLTLYHRGGFVTVSEGDLVRVRLGEHREERFTVSAVSQGPQVLRLTVRRSEQVGEQKP